MAGLAEHPLFATLTPARRDELESSSKRLRVAADETILRAKEHARIVYALLSGSVRVFHEQEDGDEADSAEIVVKTFAAPALFGEAEALNGMKYVQSAAAIEPCELIAIDVERFVVTMKAEPLFCFEVCKDLAARLAISSYHEKSIAFHPATVRLANYLLDCATRTPDGLEIALSQGDMARAVGITRRSVAKDFADWQKEGLLQRIPRGYRILDVERLQGYADPERLSLHYSLASNPGDAGHKA